jgi:pimeloyl-ACP methyl ester carboxylesterase
MEFAELGEGTPVVMLPGLGGSALEQYEDLGRRVADAGFRAVPVNPRGVAGSVGPLEGLTLSDYARDVAAVIDEVGGKAHLVGRAYGNRLARCVAAEYPERVLSVTLIACGGRFPPETKRGMSRADMLLARKSPRSLARVFGHDPAAATAQEAALGRTPLSRWWGGGRARMLVVQGLEDVIAVPANGRALASEFPDRVRLVEFADAGHYVLFERPEEVARHVLQHLGEGPPGSRG